MCFVWAGHFIYTGTLPLFNLNHYPLWMEHKWVIFSPVPDSASSFSRTDHQYAGIFFLFFFPCSFFFSFVYLQALVCFMVFLFLFVFDFCMCIFLNIDICT
ncbi:hypothetical protein HanIR_Chr09g0449601 [Helianthus annuus]|nr:hypothetical protein HanIR_Chr09g0449601 [Helianthus annuus]